MAGKSRARSKSKIMQQNIKILTDSGATELSEQSVSPSRNLFFGSPKSSAVSDITEPAEILFADDSARPALLWEDGAETPITLAVSEFGTGKATWTPSIPDPLCSRQIADVIEIDSILDYERGKQTISPTSSSIILRLSEAADGGLVAVPFLKIGELELCINGTAIMAGTKDNKSITSANYTDGSVFRSNLNKNLPKTTLITVLRAYYESRGGEVNVKKGARSEISPFANCVATISRVNSGKTVGLTITSSDKFAGESYFLSFCVLSTPRDIGAKITGDFTLTDGTHFTTTRYVDIVENQSKEDYTRYYAQFTFPTSSHPATKAYFTFSTTAEANNVTITEVMLSRSEVLTPYSFTQIDSDELFALLEALDIEVTYPLARAKAGRAISWKTWKAGGLNMPTKTVTAGYSGGYSQAVLSLTQSNIGGADSSAVTIGVNGQATSGHYIDEKGVPFTGFFFSSREDLQTSAGFLTKWLFAAAARKVTITDHRGGDFGELMEQAGKVSTYYYLTSPPPQSLVTETVELPSVKSSHIFLLWRTPPPEFSFDKTIYDITFRRSCFLGFRGLIIDLNKHIPAVDIVTFAASHANEAADWFTSSPNSPVGQAPNVSATYLDYLQRKTLTNGQFSLTILGFSRFYYSFNGIETATATAGAMPHHIELRADAPCRYVETWCSTAYNISTAKVEVLYNGQTLRYPLLNSMKNHIWFYIITFKSGISQPTQYQFNEMMILAFPDNVKSIQVGYYSPQANTFFPTLCYYQLNQN